MNKNLTRLLTVIIVLISYISGTETTIQCYRCTILPPTLSSNETERLCSNFDYSDKYIVNCQYSTVCMKKSFEITIKGASVHGVMRDCAPQKYRYQAYVQGKWQMQSTIEEPYEEGCKNEDDKGARLGTTEYCYCRGYLCNAGSNLEESSYHVDAICVIFVYNTLKLFYNLR